RGCPRNTAGVHARRPGKVSLIRAVSFKRLRLNEVFVASVEESVVAVWLVVRSGVEISDDDIGRMSNDVIRVIDLDVSVGFNGKALFGDHVISEVDEGELSLLNRGINVLSVDQPRVEGRFGNRGNWIFGKNQYSVGAIQGKSRT